MKTVFEYDEVTGCITDSKGVVVCMLGMSGFDAGKETSLTLELIKQGVTTDEIIKLNNAGLL